jgi:hypothetical protein
MFRKIMIAVLLLGMAALYANPGYYPRTLIAEDFCGDWCPTCLDAAAGLDTLHANYTNNEFISTRYYMQSGDLSNADSDARAAYYGVDLVPTVIFNGVQTVSGGGDDIADGSTFHGLVQPKIYSTSPIKITVTDFNSTTGYASARVTMISPDYALNSQSLTFILMENNLTATDTRVVRAVITNPLTLSGENNYFDTDCTFTILPAYNTANLWVAAIAQLNDHSIIQAASSLPQPQYQIRAAMPFSTALVDSANINYNSDPIWFFNLGQADDFTIMIEQDDAPADWYFNFCDEDNCYPGFIPHAFSLGAGEMTTFHLNLSIGSNGIAHFRFVIDSPHLDQPYEIPFSYQTSDTPADDQIQPVTALALLQNYPNPFNASTSFRIESPKDGKPVEVQIFNTKGQKVRQLTSGQLTTGTNEISWDGKDYLGKSLPQGIYYYKIKGASADKVRRLLIMANK